MKKFSFLFILFVLTLPIFLSCENTVQDIQPDDETKEYKHLRVLISDEFSPVLSLVTPFDRTVASHTAKFPKSELYVTGSGRFTGVVHRTNNITETFDSGLENHGDHVDIKGTPKFGAMIGESSLPTHFKSRNGELMTFNDGDATLSVGSETDIHTVGVKMRTINAGLLKHHGAMAHFNNGNYAITEKDNSISGALPERVKIIDKSGKTIHPSPIATRGIHGNATDGTHAVFGSASGILVVQNNGQQRLIAYPDGFGSGWFGTILETANPGKFVGYTAAKGAYLIDIVTNSVKPIFENTDIMQCKVSYNASKLGVLLHSGDFKLFDLTNLSLLKEGRILDVTDKTSTQKPQLVLSERNAYVTQPITGELLQVRLADLNQKNRIKTGSTPYRLTLVGHESNADH